MEGQKVIVYQGRTSPFSPTCEQVMDFFLSYPKLFHTPLTVSLYLKKSNDTIKNCMSLLLKNSYLSKISETSAVYFITSSNMEFWRNDFKNHILLQCEIKNKNLA